MSIRDSSKLRNIAAALSLIALLYVVIDVPLKRLAAWAERSAASYPWPDEDYLRYLLPTLFEGHGDERIFLVGPSEAREDFIYEQFDSAFPGASTYQGGIGGGSFQDLLAALAYVEAEYGRDALPSTIVLGITPRFIANIPRAPAPVIQSINSYSPDWSVAWQGNVPSLEHKTVAEGVVAQLSFQAKQHTRYRAAVCAAALQVLNDGHTPSLAEVTRGAAAETGAGGRAWDWVMERLYFCRAPYRYHGRKAVPATAEGARLWLTSPHSFWPRVHAWDPYSEREMVEAQLGQIVHFSQRNAIALFVVNLPEHPENRAQYRPGYHERYLEVVRGAIGATPFLDLRTMLPADAYVDHAHAGVRGAQRVTARTIDFIRTTSAQASAAVPGDRPVAARGGG